MLALRLIDPRCSFDYTLSCIRSIVDSICFIDYPIYMYLLYAIYMLNVTISVRGGTHRLQGLYCSLQLLVPRWCFSLPHVLCSLGPDLVLCVPIDNIQ
jgi:hypothetical protein